MESAESPLRIDHDLYNARRTASEIIHILNRYIPDACRNEAYHEIYRLCYAHGLEFTTKMMRKEYEAWKKLNIDVLGQSCPSSKPE